MDRISVGWREWVALPELGIDRIKVKVDTGARTSALHAFRIQPFMKEARMYVRFYIHPLQRRSNPEIACEVPVIDERTVTSSSGRREHRFVVETRLRIGEFEWPIEVTLTNRDEMGFRMLLGRQALRRRLVVDPGSSYLIGAKPKVKRKRKKGIS
jgi:hypothetical protein